MSVDIVVLGWRVSERDSDVAARVESARFDKSAGM